MAGRRYGGYNRNNSLYQRETMRNNAGRMEYIEGNTARNLDALPKRRERTLPEREKRRYPQRMPVSMPGIDGTSFLFFVTMLGTAFFIAFSYLHTLNGLNGMKGEIVSIQSEIAQMEEENDIRYQEILASVDLAEVYERATKKLKMVQAKNNQVYTYRNRKSNMVKQYEDIPGAD